MNEVEINEVTESKEVDDIEKVSLFAHPLTFLVTHVLFPLLTAAAVSYLYWISVDVLKEVVLAQARLFLLAAWALPVAGLGVLLLRPRQMSVKLLFGWTFVGVAFLYLGMPLVSKMMENVDAWVCGSTPFFALVAGIVPLIFAGLVRVATAPWGWFKNPQGVGPAFACMVFPPVLIFLGFNLIALPLRHMMPDSELEKMIFSHILAIGFFLGTAAFFIGMLRLLHRMFNGMMKPSGLDTRTFAAFGFGLVLPYMGLVLNLSIPFPADFKNVWTWGLTLVTGVVVMLPVRANRWGLFTYFLKFMVGPFVLYFFLLFLPFLPMAIPAILAIGTGFLILAPTFLFRIWSLQLYGAYQELRGTCSRRCLVLVAIAGMLVMPTVFATMTEVERMDLEKLVAWQTQEEFDELEPPPPPMSMVRAKRVMTGVNDYTYGAEIPFLSAWRTWRVYGGMYMADKLRNELNLRILGKKIEDERDWQSQSRNEFGKTMFGINPGRRGRTRNFGWWGRPERTMGFSATAVPVGTNGTECVYEVLVKASPATPNSELILDFRVPAGTWIEGMELKMDDGHWKTARVSERKAAEWVYNQITLQRRDPSIVTLDSPTEGRLKVFPVGANGREVKLRLRRPGSRVRDSQELIAFAAVPLSSPPQSAFNRLSNRFQVLPGEPAKRLPWQVVALPKRDAAAAGTGLDIVGDASAGVSVVSAEWFEKHAAESAPSVVKGERFEYDVEDPILLSRLRRRLRHTAKQMADGKLGELPNLAFVDVTFTTEQQTDDTRSVKYRNGRAVTVEIVATNRQVVAKLPLGALTAKEVAVLQRELPGLAALGDRPVDAWYAMKTVDGGQVAVPYRKGEDTLVFARLAGAVEGDAAWKRGAAAWAVEHEAFLHPAQDRRRELLALTRAGGALTTQSALIAVETATQEKGLKQKEMEALHGDKALDFDETMASDGDAPGFWLLCLGLLLVALVRKLKHALIG